MVKATDQVSPGQFRSQGVANTAAVALDEARDSFPQEAEIFNFAIMVEDDEIVISLDPGGITNTNRPRV